MPNFGKAIENKPINNNGGAIPMGGSTDTDRNSPINTTQGKKSKGSYGIIEKNDLYKSNSSADFKFYIGKYVILRNAYVNGIENYILNSAGNGKRSKKNSVENNFNIVLSKVEIADLPSKFTLFQDEIDVVDNTKTIEYYYTESYNGHEYSIETSDNIYKLIAKNYYGLQNAAYNLLHSLGFYYFSPNPIWFVRPSSLGVVNISRTSPSYISRRFFLNYGHGAENVLLNTRLSEFLTLNAMDIDIYPTGHSWGNIINRNQQAFLDNPNLYKDSEVDPGLALASRSLNIVVDNESDQVNVDALDNLVAADRKALLNENKVNDPNAFCVSYDPRDSDDHTTNQVIASINRVAKKVKSDGVWLSVYAYAGHRSPPTIPMEQNIFVQVALGFNNTELTYDELIDQWGSAAAQIGLREYGGVQSFTQGLPAQAKLQKPDYMFSKYPLYNQKGALAMNTENTAYWPSQIFGFYCLHRMLSNINVSKQDCYNKVLEKCFNNNIHIQKLREYWDKNPKLNDFLIRKSLDHVYNALSIETDDDVIDRINHIKKYLFLCDEYRNTIKISSQFGRGDEYYNAFKIYMSHVYTLKDEDIVHYYAIARFLANSAVTADGRYDYWIFRQTYDQQDPVWMYSNTISDTDIDTAYTTLQNNTQLTDYGTQFVECNPPGMNEGLTNTPGYFTARGVVDILLFGLSTVEIIADNQDVEIDDSIIIKKNETYIYSGSNKYLRVNGSDCRIKLLTGNAALYCSPEVSPYVHLTGTSFWGYIPSGITSLNLYSDVRVTTYHNLDGAPSTRYDTTPADVVSPNPYATITVQPQTAYQINSPNTRGQINLFNAPYWASMRRNKMILPKTVADNNSLSYTNIYTIE